MSERKQMIFLFIGLFAEILIIYSIVKDDIGIYCRNYYSVVNYADNKSYEAIKDENGPIDREKIIDGNYEFKTEFIYYEDGRTFVFSIFPSGSKRFCRVDVTGEQYRFGRKKIGVGTNRKQIEAIYKGKNNKYYENDKQINIIESNTSVSFYFDEQNIVYKISVGEPDIYE